MTDIRPKHMDAALRCWDCDDRSEPGSVFCARCEAAKEKAIATADLTAERNDLLVANGQLTTECAGLRETRDVLITDAQDRDGEVQRLRAELARLKRRAACDTCCGFGHVHIEADGVMLNAVVDHAACGLEMHEICDDCQPCPECGGGE